VVFILFYFPSIVLILMTHHCHLFTTFTVKKWRSNTPLLSNSSKRKKTVLSRKLTTPHYVQYRGVHAVPYIQDPQCSDSTTNLTATYSD
jgi:hypothetical protein